MSEARIQQFIDRGRRTGERTAAEYYFLIIPEKGESIRSVLNYPTPEAAIATGKEVAVAILEKAEAEHVPVSTIIATDPGYVDVVVIYGPTQEAVSDQRIVA